MRTFSGMDYIKIDVANNFGKDKLSWTDRLAWFEFNKNNLLDMVNEASNPFLFRKGLMAYQDAKAGKATGFIMALDATGSGLQIMSCLSGCKESAKAVNLIDSGERKDIYTFVSDQMNTKLCPEHYVNRSMIKKNVMTHYYNKTKPDGLTEVQELAFFNVLQNSFTGPEDVMALIKDCWDSTALFHKWTAPDGHVCKVKVEEKEDKRIEIDELGVTFTYRYNANKPSKRSTSLCPNYVHSLDGWVAREMVRRAHKQKFQLAHIHDSFWASPNHMNEVRSNYVNILAELANSDALQKFMEQLGIDTLIEKDSTDLHLDILQSEYALS